MVPVLATEAMIEEGRDENAVESEIGYHGAKHCWFAMLAKGRVA